MGCMPRQTFERSTMNIPIKALVPASALALYGAAQLGRWGWKKTFGRPKEK